jgi:hypothetical protein
MQNYTVPQLREIAARLFVHHTTKTRKVDLIDAIRIQVNTAHEMALIENARRPVTLIDFSLSRSGYDALKRERVYKRQNRCDKLTPRQARRIKHKTNRAARAL